MAGINNPIEALRTLFENNLWTAFNPVFHGRCYRNERNGQLIPEVNISGTNEYKEVLLQDFQDATVFFDVDPTRTVLGASDVTGNVSIYFAIDLNTLYPALDRNDSIETAYKDVIKIINASSFDFQAIVSGFDSYSTFAYDQDMVDNMQPYHLFRVDTEVIYNLNC